ncbi:hypothetical protein [Streptomyces cellostaticus]|uniref:hypothetical protein n=1 Tax=Streptomyces cellostaticus TaxID=67285 RepID=UPI00131B1828|nr:hypothetical protein [Streptomyces cellostaticus]GHI04585.1 hypothetical protein Scel_29060 [Streptomyces cellostaticus]
MSVVQVAHRQQGKPDLGQLAIPSRAVARRPCDFTAFCLLHQSAYLQYAVQRLQDIARARACVARVVRELSAFWPAFLGSAQPAAVAWVLLRAWVDRTAGSSSCGTLSRDQADVLLLRGSLDFSLAKIASVMGVEEAVVVAHLRSATRILAIAD